MAPKTKQADRNAAKRAGKKVEEEEPAAVSAGKGSVGKLGELGKTLVMGSCLLKMGPKLKDLLEKSGDAKPAPPPKEEKVEGEEREETEDTAADGEKSANGAVSEEEAMFVAVASRLTWYNALGLAFPETGSDAVAKWMSFKALELDWGPRKARRGTPSADRILANFCNNLAQYLHVLLALMMLRAFLFRSYFACLPWLFGYQAASLLVPADMVPQVQLKFRVAAALGLNALLWLFFLYETVWKMWFFEKIFVGGLLAFHAHSVRPLDN